MVYTSILPASGNKHLRNFSFKKHSSFRTARSLNEQPRCEKNGHSNTTINNKTYNRRKTMKSIYLVISVAGAMVLSNSAVPAETAAMHVDTGFTPDSVDTTTIMLQCTGLISTTTPAATLFI
jgi:hypothetical protein